MCEVLEMGFFCHRPKKRQRVSTKQTFVVRCIDVLIFLDSRQFCWENISRVCMEISCYLHSAAFKPFVISNGTLVSNANNAWYPLLDTLMPGLSDAGAKMMPYANGGWWSSSLGGWQGGRHPQRIISTNSWLSGQNLSSITDQAGLAEEGLVPFEK